MGVVSPDQTAKSDGKVNQHIGSPKKENNIEAYNMGKGGDGSNMQPKLKINEEKKDGCHAKDLTKDHADLADKMNNLCLRAPSSHDEEMRQVLQKLKSVDLNSEKEQRKQKIPVENEESWEEGDEEPKCPSPLPVNEGRKLQTLDGKEVPLIPKAPYGGVRTQCEQNTVDPNSKMRQIIELIDPSGKYMRPNQPRECPDFSSVATMGISGSFDFAGRPINRTATAQDMYGMLDKRNTHNATDIVSMRALNGGSMECRPTAGIPVAPPVNNSRNSSMDSEDIHQFNSTDNEYIDDLYQQLSSPDSAFSPSGSEYTAATSPASNASTYGPNSPHYPEDDSLLYGPSIGNAEDKIDIGLPESELEKIIGPEKMAEMVEKIIGREKMAEMLAECSTDNIAPAPNIDAPTADLDLSNMLGDEYVDQIIDILNNNPDFATSASSNIPNGPLPGQNIPTVPNQSQISQVAPPLLFDRTPMERSSNQGMAPAQPASSASPPHAPSLHNTPNASPKRKVPGGNPWNSPPQQLPTNRVINQNPHPTPFNPSSPKERQVIQPSRTPPHNPQTFNPPNIPLNIPLNIPVPINTSPSNLISSQNIPIPTSQNTPAKPPNFLPTSTNPTQVAAPIITTTNTPIYHIPPNIAHNQNMITTTVAATTTNTNIPLLSQPNNAPILVFVTTPQGGATSSSQPITIKAAPTVQLPPLSQAIFLPTQTTGYPTTRYPKIAPKIPEPKMEAIVRPVPPMKLEPTEEDRAPEFKPYAQDRQKCVKAQRWLAGQKDETIYGEREDGDVLLMYCAMKEMPYHSYAIIMNVKNSKPREVFMEYINKRNFKEQTALYQATVVNCWEIVSLLIKEGADPNFAAKRVSASGDVQYLNALHVAAIGGERYLSTLKCLLSSPLIQKDALNSDSQTALYCAALAHGKCYHENETINSTKTMQVLLRHGADISKQDGRTGNTTLHAIVETRDILLLRTVLGMLPTAILLPALNKTSYQGNTCLHTAAQLPSKTLQDKEVQKQIIHLLIDYKIEKSIKNNMQRTAKDLLKDLSKVSGIPDPGLLDRMKPGSRRQ